MRALNESFILTNANYKHILYVIITIITEAKFVCESSLPLIFDEHRTMHIEILFEFSRCSVKLSRTIQEQRHKSQTLFLRFTIVLRSRARILDVGCFIFTFFSMMEIFKRILRLLMTKRNR